MADENKKTFYKVTNGEIFKKLENIEVLMEKSHRKARIAVAVSTLSCTLSMMALSFLFQHMIN